MMVMNQTLEIVESYENYEEQHPIILLDGNMDENLITFYPGSADIMFCFKKVIDEVIIYKKKIKTILDLSLNLLIFWK